METTTIESGTHIYIYMGVIVGNVGFLELSCLLLGSKATTCHPSSF